MNNDESFNELAEIVKNELLPPLKSALKACADRHQLTKEDGSDNFSFGTDAWSFPKYAFKTHIQENETPLRVSNQSGCVLICGKYEIRHHRVGDSANDDIRSSFPNGARAASIAASSENMTFSFMDTDPEHNNSVVLAYMANPDVGLCAAYIAIPNHIENQKIEGWGKIVEIYRKNNESELFAQNNGQELTKPETVEEPKVSIEKKSKQISKE